MNAKFHGVTSLLLESLAILVGFTAIWQNHKIAGILYGVLILASVPAILFSYCAKCEVRLTGCRHIFPGQITRLLPTRDEKAYHIMDYLGLLLPAAALIIFPQPWLVNNKPLFTLFWACLVGGVVQILLRVCKGCGNSKCIMCHLRN